MRQAGGISERKAETTRYRTIGRVLFGMALACLLFFAGGIETEQAMAAGATVTVSTKQNTVVEGDTVYVVITVSSGDAIKGFDAYFTYNSRVLRYVTGGNIAHGNDDSFRIRDTSRSASATKITYSVKFIARQAGEASITLRKPYHVYADDDSSSEMSISYHALNVVVKKQGGATTKPKSTKPPKETPSAAPAQSEKPQETEKPEESEQPTQGKNDVPGSSKLRKLSVGGAELVPEFSPKIKKYSAIVTTDETDLKIDYKAKDSQAKVTVKGNKNLTEGKNVIKVIVNGTTGERTTYRLSLTVQRTDSKEKANHLTVSKKKGKYYLIGDSTVEVLPVPDEETIPEGFEKVEITIDGKEITSYALEGDEDGTFVLIYGKGNKEEFYLYDREENILMPYEKAKSWYRSLNGQSQIMASDEERMIQSLKYVIGIMAGFCGLMLLIAIGASIRSYRR